MDRLQTLTDKATLFRRLHQRDKAFVIPNPWEVGSTKILENLGFEALATTRAAFSMEELSAVGVKRVSDGSGG